LVVTNQANLKILAERTIYKCKFVQCGKNATPGTHEQRFEQGADAGR
jgi:hypothetical protein